MTMFDAHPPPPPSSCLSSVLIGTICRLGPPPLARYLARVPLAPTLILLVPDPTLLSLDAPLPAAFVPRGPRRCGGGLIMLNETRTAAPPLTIGDGVTASSRRIGSRGTLRG